MALETSEEGGPVTRRMEGVFPKGIPAKIEPDGLHLPVVRLERAKVEITLGGVAHLGDAAYWEAWRREILARLAADREVQIELVRSEVNPDGFLPKPLQLAGRGMVRAIEATGLTLQTSIIKPLLPRLTVTDISLEGLKEKMGKDIVFILAASLFAYPVVALVTLANRQVLPAVLVKSLEESEDLVSAVRRGMRLSPMRERTQRRNAVLLEARNTYGIEALDSAKTGTLALWGAAHLPGIIEGLQERGWSVSGVDWRVALSS